MLYLFLFEVHNITKIVSIFEKLFLFMRIVCQGCKESEDCGKCVCGGGGGGGGGGFLGGKE